jgi:FkbM family methyltransferase
MVPEGSTACDSWTGLRCEIKEVSFILGVLRPGMTFFDVGANAGLFAVSAAKRIGGASVYAFEPCSQTCEILKRNLGLNRVSDVNTLQVALGDIIGEGILQVNARGKDGLNTLGRASHPDSQVVGQENVRITTVDAFVKEHHIPRIDVMKADIEGAELMLFRGAKRLLQRGDAPIILYEGFGFLTRGLGYHPVEILWFLESCGYQLFVLNSDAGGISELKPDYQYNSMVIAAKPGHPAYARLQASVK